MINHHGRVSVRLAVFVALFVLAASCGVSRDSNAAPAATITFGDGSSIVVERAELDDLSADLRDSERFLTAAGLPVEDVELVALNQLIQTRILVQALDDAGGSISTSSLAARKGELEEQLVQIVGVDDAPEVAGEISAYIELVSQSLVVSDELGPVLLESGVEVPTNPCVSHILVEDADLANDLFDQLNGGADFSELALANSTDPGSAAAGGELGCESPDRFVPEFRDATLAAVEGEVTEPVQSDFGYHLILVTGYEEDSSNLAAEAIQRAFTESQVEVDPIFGIWDGFSNQVVAGPES